MQFGLISFLSATRLRLYCSEFERCSVIDWPFSLVHYTSAFSINELHLRTNSHLAVGSTWSRHLDSIVQHYLRLLNSIASGLRIA